MAVWKIDHEHTKANFAVRHMRISMVRGHFGQVSGLIHFDPENPQLGMVEAEIETTSIATGVPERDAHLMSSDFLNVKLYPSITFKSTQVQVKSKEDGLIYGDLTIRGVTLPVILETTFRGTSNNPLDNRQTIGFEATTIINREDFGLRWNVDLDSGGVLVGNNVRITLDVEAILVTEPSRVG